MLTYTEVLKSRTDPRYFFTHDADYLEYEKMIDEALEKQIPKEPNIIPETQIQTADGRKFTVKSNCPRCGVPFIENCIPQYCAKCGQAIDWSK